MVFYIIIDCALIPGVYAVLFSMCTYILCARKKPGRALFLATTIAMFCLATANVILNLVGHLLHDFGTESPSFLIYTTSK